MNAPVYREIPRALLLASYQHLLLALLVGCLLAWTQVPAIAVLAVAAAQFWRMRLMRSKAVPAQAPNPWALLHTRVYYRRAQLTLLTLGAALVLGLGVSLAMGEQAGLRTFQLLVSVAMAGCLVAVWPGYRHLATDPDHW